MKIKKFRNYVNSISSALILLLVVTFYQGEVLCEEIYTCMGFYSPTLAVDVRDAISNESIKTASVYLGRKNLPAIPIVFNNEQKVYFSLLGESGTLDLRVEHPDYKFFRDNDFRFTVNAGCGGKNDWVYRVYLCPSGKDCSKSLKSHKIPPQNP